MLSSLIGSQKLYLFSKNLFSTTFIWDMIFTGFSGFGPFIDLLCLR